MSLNETYCKFRVGKHLSEEFPVKNGLKQVDALLPLLFNFVLDYGIKRGQVNPDGLKINGKHKLWCMLVMLIYWV